MTNTTRTYAKRDSAVAVLKKAGIAREDYNQYISQNGDKFELEQQDGDGHFMKVQLTEVPVTEDTVESLVEQAKARNAANGERLKNGTTLSAKHELAVDEDEDEVAAKKAARAAKANRPAAAKKATTAAKKTATAKSDKANSGISEWIRGQITAGKTNKEIVEASAAAGFDLTGKKAYFPSWYRFDMKRKAAAK